MTPRGSQRRFRPFFMLVILGLLAGGFMYLRCGDEFGLGGGGQGGVGDGDGEPGGERKDKAEKGEKADEAEKAEEQTGSDVRPAVGGAAAGGGVRCKLRLDASGLTLDGRPSTVEKAVKECKQAGGAELTVTGDAVFGDRNKIRQALERARVELFVREVSVPER